MSRIPRRTSPPLTWCSASDRIARVGAWSWSLCRATSVLTVDAATKPQKNTPIVPMALTSTKSPVTPARISIPPLHMPPNSTSSALTDPLRPSDRREASTPQAKPSSTLQATPRCLRGVDASLTTLRSEERTSAMQALNYTRAHLPPVLRSSASVRLRTSLIFLLLLN